MHTKGIVLGLVGVLLIAAVFAQRSRIARVMAPPPEPEKISVLKIGFVSDSEHGSRKRLKHKLPIQGVPELEKVVAYYNEVFHPDIVIGGGDYIESSSTKP